MQEFMTKVSDYISEWRNDPERQGSMTPFIIMGVAILIILLFCLLLLWYRRTVIKEEVKEETVVQTPFMGDALSEEVREEYLTSIQYLESEVDELLTNLTLMQEALEEALTVHQEDNTFLWEQITLVVDEVNSIILELHNTQSELYDLTDIVNIMRSETIPEIQEQITRIKEQVDLASADIENIYEKIAALEEADDELRAKIKALEDSFTVAAEQNKQDVTNQFQDVSNQFQNVFEQIQELSAWMLRYRYDDQTNTLYLFPNT